jgi:hypothetical protein
VVVRGRKSARSLEEEGEHCAPKCSGGDVRFEGTMDTELQSQAGPAAVWETEAQLNIGSSASASELGRRRDADHKKLKGQNVFVVNLVLTDSGRLCCRYPNLQCSQA